MGAGPWREYVNLKPNDLLCSPWCCFAVSTRVLRKSAEIQGYWAVRRSKTNPEPGKKKKKTDPSCNQVKRHIGQVRKKACPCADFFPLETLRLRPKRPSNGTRVEASGGGKAKDASGFALAKTSDVQGFASISTCPPSLCCPHNPSSTGGPTNPPSRRGPSWSKLQTKCHSPWDFAALPNVAVFGEDRRTFARSRTGGRGQGERDELAVSATGH